MSRPDRAYLVCATARSGSTLLCKTLASTGVAGVPEEFFEARRDTGRPPTAADYLGDAPGVDWDRLAAAGLPEVPDYSDVRGVDDYAEHLARVFDRGTTPNGVFGAKLMWMQTSELVAFASTLPSLDDAAGLPEVIAELFGAPTYVWVRRADTVHQAISLWRALESQHWRSGSDEERKAPDPLYSFPGIHALRLRLERDDAAWGAYFAEHAIAPLVLEYEDVEADPDAAVGRVLAAIGVDSLDASPPQVTTQRQRDDLSEEWARRYRDDLAAPSTR